MDLFNERRILLQLPLAALFTIIIAFIFNNAFFYLSEGLQSTGYEMLFTPISLMIAGILSYFAFDLHSNTITMEEVPIAIIVLSIVSLIGALFDPFRIEIYEIAGGFSQMGQFGTIILMLAYTFLGISIAEQYVLGE